MIKIMFLFRFIPYIAQIKTDKMLKDRIILPDCDPPFDDDGAFSQDKPEEKKCPRCLEPESECQCDKIDAKEKEDVFKTLGDVTRPEKPKPANPLMSFVNKLNKSFGNGNI